MDLKKITLEFNRNFSMACNEVIERHIIENGMVNEAIENNKIIVQKAVLDDLLNDIVTVEENPMVQIIKRRAEYLGMKISTMGALFIMSLFQSQQIGVAIMYLTYFAIQLRVLGAEKGKDGKILLSVYDMALMLGGKKLNEESIEKIWDSQKVPAEERKFPAPDNGIDFLNGDILDKMIVSAPINLLNPFK